MTSRCLPKTSAYLSPAGYAFVVLQSNSLLCLGYRAKGNACFLSTHPLVSYNILWTSQGWYTLKGAYYKL
ncbi:Uncharacterized protein APZ42_016241 [Daphnia magna]|uniref:Uncharacterized protein n=1 Tax=Daphnia magna TaxID=35525 RepID=A0A165AIX6_9CRUS|nr:Uncharacterized protein APZ42_016241 [Daphnia magna]